MTAQRPYRPNYLTSDELEQWRAELLTQNLPEWAVEFREDMRRLNCPAFAEIRAEVRRRVRDMISTIRKAKDMPPEWLKPAGHVRVREWIRNGRAEHTRLISDEQAKLGGNGS